MFIHVSSCVDRAFSLRSLTSSSLSSASTPSLISSSPLSWSSSSMWSKPPSTKSPAHPQNEEYCPVAIPNPLTGYEPNQLDNFDISETFCRDLPEWIRRHRHGTVVLVQWGTRRWPFWKSAIFTTLHSGARRTSELETNLSLSRRKLVASSVLFAHARPERPVCELSSCQKRKSSREMENERNKILVEWQKEQILTEVRTEIQKKEFQADSDRRVFRNWMELLILSEWKLIILLQGVTNPGEINYYLKKNYQNKIGLFMKIVSGICETWKKIGRGSRYYPWTHWQDTGIAKMKIIVWMIQETFKMLNQYAVDIPQSTSVFPTSSNSWRNAKPFSGNAEPQQWTAKYWRHTWYTGKRFCKSNGVFFTTLSARVQSLDF